MIHDARAALDVKMVAEISIHGTWTTHPAYLLNSGGANVWYTHSAQVAKENGTDYAVWYTWHHAPTGKSGVSRCFVVGGAPQAERLIDWWSRGDTWTYAIIDPATAKALLTASS